MNLRYYGTIPADSIFLLDARARAKSQLEKITPKVSKFVPSKSKHIYNFLTDGKAKMELTNCPACDTPLNGGECDLCRSLETVTEAKPIPQTEKPIWNWEQFNLVVRNDEKFLISQFDSDEKIEERILALQELERQSDLIKQAFRIRIQEDQDELKARGKAVKSKQSLTDKNYIPLAPVAGLPRKSAVKMTADEKIKADLEKRGINFDEYMDKLNKAGL